MKLSVLFALFALMLNVANGDGHAGGHDGMKMCGAGEVAVMGYGSEMICVGSCKIYRYCLIKSATIRSLKTVYLQ